MTSFRLSELPTPYRSTGASPLGTHEGTVTPPEPPTPPTPTGKVYFSGTSTSVEPDTGDGYRYRFDTSGFENIDTFLAKEQGDTLSITVNGVANEGTIHEKIVETEDDITCTDFDIQLTGADVGVGFETDGGVSTCYNVLCIIGGEQLESATLVIADPS